MKNISTLLVFLTLLIMPVIGVAEKKVAAPVAKKNVSSLTAENKVLKQRVADLEKRLKASNCADGSVLPVTTNNSNVVDVSIKTRNTYGDTPGFEQEPQSIAYKFDNKSDKDVYITAMDLTFGTVNYDAAWYSISETFRSKDNFIKIPIDGKLSNFQFEKAVKIPANGATTLYVNSWGYPNLRFGGEGSGTTTLRKVYSNTTGLQFNLGSSVGLGWTDPHRKTDL